MVTSKKKSDSITLEMPGTKGSAKIVLPKEKKKQKVVDHSGVVKGSHLTVTTFSDGNTKLDWDDEALLRDVRAAILKAESNILASDTAPKRTKKDAAMNTASKKSKTK